MWIVRDLRSNTEVIREKDQIVFHVGDGRINSNHLVSHSVESRQNGEVYG